MEKSYSAALGLPCMIRPRDFHVRPLTPEDFDQFDDNSQLFVEMNKINCLRARMLEVHWRKGEGDGAEVGFGQTNRVHLDIYAEDLDSLPCLMVLNVRLIHASTGRVRYSALNEGVD